MGGLVLYEEAKKFRFLDQNSKLLETMNSKQKSRLNLVKIQRVCPRGVRADPGIHPVDAQARGESNAPRCVSVCVDLLFLRQLVTNTWCTWFNARLVFFSFWALLVFCYCYPTRLRARALSLTAAPSRVARSTQYPVGASKEYGKLRYCRYRTMARAAY